VHDQPRISTHIPNIKGLQRILACEKECAQAHSLRARHAADACAAHTQSFAVTRDVHWCLAEQDHYGRLSEEWRVKQAADLEAKAAELAALTAERERQRAQLEAYQARYDRDVAELAEQEVRQEAAEVQLWLAGEAIGTAVLRLGHHAQIAVRAGG